MLEEYLSILQLFDYKNSVNVNLDEGRMKCFTVNKYMFIILFLY